MKRTIAILMVMVLIVSVFCGCGAKADAVGEWYNVNNKCLEIRKDGTYKMEGEYGTGRWKVLDDGEIIEFTDFYGSTRESKINVDEKGEYISYGRNFYRDSYPAN